MDITKALNIIKKNLTSNVVESKHFKDQCSDRRIELPAIKQIVNEEHLASSFLSTTRQTRISLREASSRPVILTD